jgi:hypothetical protein
MNDKRAEIRRRDARLPHDRGVGESVQIATNTRATAGTGKRRISLAKRELLRQ